MPTSKFLIRSLFALLLLGLCLGFKAPEKALQIAKEPALSLTASDGTGLELRELKVSSVLEGFVAFTEVELVFFNPEPRQREGRFSMLLPQRASLSRFAMQIGGRWQEGEVVETQKARRAYEDFLHRRQDPALLEQDAGNRFSARVFPIEGQAEKRLVISYSELLEGGLGGYRFPLAGLPELGRLEMNVRYRGLEGAGVGKWTPVVVKERDFKPLKDFSLDLNGGAPKKALGLRAGKLAALSFRPLGGEGDLGISRGENWMVLVDSSASQAPEFEGKLGRLEGILGRLKGLAKPAGIRMAAFDQEFRDLGEMAPGQALALRERMALGASDFEAAFSKLEGGKGKRLLLVSDGAATAGETAPGKLREMLAKVGFARVDCLSLGSFKDAKALAELSQAGLKSGLVLDGGLEDEALAGKLAAETGPEIEVEVPGAVWVWPRSFKGIQAGDEAIVFAELAEGQALEIKYLGKSLAPEMLEAEPRLLKREWVKARMEKLLWEEERAKDKDVKNGLHNEVIRISEEERVLSPYTSLLVLETEADYERFGIKRDALSDILVVGASGLELKKRGEKDWPVPTLTPTPQAIVMKKMAAPSRSLNFDPGLAAAKPEALAGASSNRAQEFEAPPAVHEESRDDGALSLPRAADSAPSPASPAPGPDMRMVEGAPAGRPEAAVRPRMEGEGTYEADEGGSQEQEPEKVEPWDGDYAAHRALLKAGQAAQALEKAKAWYLSKPEDALALLALGESFAALGKGGEAARAYGSLIDHFPSRVDIRRWAAGRLLALKAGLGLAIDSLEKAKLQRPDHASTVVLLASAYMQAGKKAAALKVLEEGAKGNYSGGCREIQRILASLRGFAGKVADGGPALKMGFLLTWETDANDVDFHIYDARGGHAWYSKKQLKSGGELYEDVTTGYGPEFFGIPDPKAGPYRLKAHYYSRGPMGYGMGLLQVIKVDAKKGLTLEARPFVIMRDHAYVDLGTVAQP